MTGYVWFGCTLLFVLAIVLVVAAVTAFALLARTKGQQRPTKRQVAVAVGCLLVVALVIGGFCWMATGPH